MKPPRVFDSLLISHDARLGFLVMLHVRNLFSHLVIDYVRLSQEMMIHIPDDHPDVRNLELSLESLRRFLKTMKRSIDVSLQAAGYSSDDVEREQTDRYVIFRLSPHGFGIRGRGRKWREISRHLNKSLTRYYAT